MIEKYIAGTFGLILVFLLLSRAAEFNSIIQTVGGFWTAQTQILQGVGSFGLQGSSAATAGQRVTPGFSAGQA